MEKISKEELREWVTALDNVACFRLGASPSGLRFTCSGMHFEDAIDDVELEARLQTRDPELAQRFRVWYDATVSLGIYAHTRREGRDG